MPHHYGLLFPHGAVSTNFGMWALSQGHKLSLCYAGDTESSAFTRNMVTDLRVCGSERGRVEGEDACMIVADKNYRGIKTAIIPNVDVLPQNPDHYYVDLCMNRFRQVETFNH